MFASTTYNKSRDLTCVGVEDSIIVDVILGEVTPGGQVAGTSEFVSHVEYPVLWRKCDDVE